MRLLLLLDGFERNRYLIFKAMKYNPERDNDHDGEDQIDGQTNQSRFLFPFDGGDDRRATLGTSPRMVADLSAAFVTFN